MAGIKLARLPDRTPVKLTFNASPDLKIALDEYLATYRSVYPDSSEVTTVDLIPAMLETFLKSDCGFQRQRP